MLQKKKDNLLGKIVRKNYNNKLEEVLEHKKFSEHTKSLLLSMLYKIEGAYPDYEKAKRNVESKEEYIENIISTIQNQCSTIEVISPNSERSQELGQRTFVIDEVRKTIKCYPVERKLLYAIAKIGKKEYIIDKEKYDMLSKPLSNLINIGSNINTVEPLRDFNGYSWTTLSREIESIEHNIVYQNLRILLGYQFLKDWVENREFVADYMLLFKRKIKLEYGDRNAKNIEDLVSQIAILLEMKVNEQSRKQLEYSGDELLSKLAKVTDIKEFTAYVSKRKKEINEKIREIDTILNNSKYLQIEYERRNSVLPLEKKIFSMRVLAEQLVRERENEFEKIEKLNKLLMPKNFVRYKKELEDKEKIYNLIKTENIDIELRKLIIQLQKVFMKCFEIKIQQARTKNEVMQLVYEFRYYFLLMFDSKNSIGEIPELQNDIERTISALLVRTKLEGITGQFTTIKDLENKIYKEIFLLKTISLEDIYMAPIKEDNIIFMQLYDENEFERKIELGTIDEIPKRELGLKFNKKVKVFY